MPIFLSQVSVPAFTTAGRRFSTTSRASPAASTAASPTSPRPSSCSTPRGPTGPSTTSRTSPSTPQTGSARSAAAAIVSNNTTWVPIKCFRMLFSLNAFSFLQGGLSVAKKVSLAASLPDSDSESVFQEERDRRLLQSNNNKNRSTKIRSNSLTPKISDLGESQGVTLVPTMKLTLFFFFSCPVAPPSDSSGLGPSFDQHYLSGSAAALDPNNSLNLPSGNDPRFRPEKIVLQQNWLEEPLPRTPASRRGSSRRSSRGFGNLSRSNSVQDCSLSIPSRHQFEFGRNTGEKERKKPVSSSC